MTVRLRYRATIILLFLALASTAGADALHDLYDQTLAEAETGNAVSMYEIGRMRELGVGVERDKKAALDWYRKAAEAGYLPAAYKLGMAYYTGRNVSQDYQAALQLFTLAAEQGHRQSRAVLAKMYATGKGVPIDPDAAAYWEQPYQPPQPTEQPDPNEQPEAGSGSIEAQPEQPQDPVEVEPVNEKAIQEAVAESQSAAEEEPESKGGMRRTYRDQMLYFQWTEEGRPAQGLPSETTECRKKDRNLLCITKPLIGRQGNLPYQYQIISKISSFRAPGRFDLELTYRLASLLEREIDGFEDEGEEFQATEESITEALNRKKSSYQCSLNRKWLATCTAPGMKERKFEPENNK